MEGGTLAACFKEAKPVIGVRTLEDLGLNPNPLTGELEEERPPGVAYFYQKLGSRPAIMQHQTKEKAVRNVKRLRW